MWSLLSPLVLPFLELRGPSHHACGFLIPRAVLKDLKGGFDGERGRGRHGDILLGFGLVTEASGVSVALVCF